MENTTFEQYIQNTEDWQEIAQTIAVEATLPAWAYDGHTAREMWEAAWENKTQAHAVLEAIAELNYVAMVDFLRGTKYAIPNCTDNATIVYYAAALVSEDPDEIPDDMLVTLRTIRELASQQRLEMASALAENAVIAIKVSQQPQHEVIEDKPAKLSCADADAMASAEVAYYGTLPGYEI